MGKRRPAVAAGVLFVAVVAAGCSSASTATPPEKVAATAVTSLDASPYLQATWTVSTDAVTGSGTGAATTRKVLANLKFVEEASSDNSGTNLAQAGKQEGLDLSVDYGSTTLGSLRVIDGKQLYFKLDMSSWSVLPLQLSASAKSTLAELQPLVGDRWFQLPPSLFTGASAKSDLSKAQVSELDTELLKALTTSATFSAGPGNGGQNEVDVKGSLKTLATALEPLVGQLQQLGGSVPAAGAASSALGSVSGSYLVQLFTDSSGTLQQLSGTITSGGKHATVDLAVAHAAVPVTAPPGATLLPRTLIDQFLQGVKSGTAT